MVQVRESALQLEGELRIADVFAEYLVFLDLDQTFKKTSAVFPFRTVAA